MKPINFSESTRILLPPLNMDNCEPMAIWNGDGKQCISCWKMSLKERVIAVVTGKIWVCVLSGETQPPIWVASINPFSGEKEASK